MNKMNLRTWKCVGLLSLALLTSASFARRDDATPAQVIELKAKRFAFSPGEITLKKGEPALLRLSTEDVTHGIYLKQLKIDADIQPGKVSEVSVTPQQTGKFVAICDHFCGAGHGNMHLIVNVVE
jgi:cytochrome c oxidase subunit II